VVSKLYFEEAYPEVHPDSASAHHLYDIAAAIDTLTADHRSNLATLREAFQMQHDRLSERMMESVFKCGLAEFARAPDYAAAVASELETLTQLGRTREALNLGQLTRIRDALPPEQAARLPDWDFEKKPPRRPWLRDGS
jgi:hypothetical protein